MSQVGPFLVSAAKGGTRRHQGPCFHLSKIHQSRCLQVSFGASSTLKRWETAHMEDLSWLSRRFRKISTSGACLETTATVVFQSGGYWSTEHLASLATLAMISLITLGLRWMLLSWLCSTFSPPFADTPKIKGHVMFNIGSACVALDTAGAKHLVRAVALGDGMCTAVWSFPCERDVCACAKAFSTANLLTCWVFIWC